MIDNFLLRKNKEKENLIKLFKSKYKKYKENNN